MDALNKKQIESLRERIWMVKGSLKGLGGLFTQSSASACFHDDELYGIGQLLGGLSHELSVVEEILMGVDGEDRQVEPSCESNQ